MASNKRKKKRSSRSSRRSTRFGNATAYRDLPTKETTYHGYLIETEGRSYAQPGFARAAKYGYTRHGPGAQGSSGLIFYSRAEALAAAKARIRTARWAAS